MTDPNACHKCGKTGHWARDCWSKNNNAPMDIGYVWDDETETYWVYEEEGGDDTIYNNDWPEEEGSEQDKGVDMAACFLEWTVNCITEDYTTQPT